MDCVAVASDEGDVKEPIKDPEPEPVEMEPLAMNKTPEPETAEGGIETLNYGIMSLIASGGIVHFFNKNIK